MTVEVGPDLGSEADLKTLREIEERLIDSTRYAKDIRFLRNKLMAMARRLRLALPVVDAAIDLEITLGKSPLAKAQRAELRRAVGVLKGETG